MLQYQHQRPFREDCKILRLEPLLDVKVSNGAETDQRIDKMYNCFEQPASRKEVLEGTMLPGYSRRCVFTCSNSKRPG